MPHNLSTRRLVHAERMNLQIRMAVRGGYHADPMPIQRRSRTIVSSSI
jgi:hypothetical protein